MKPDIALVEALTRSVLPTGIAVSASDPAERPETIAAEDDGQLLTAVAARKVEFLAGRSAARAAMVLLGAVPQPVPIGPDNAPIWPDGLTGSISHTTQTCVAAVGHTEDWAGIGVNLEPAEPLEADRIADVTTQAERSWLDTQPAAERGLMARLISSAKEATCKAQYPSSGQLFGFENLEIRIFRDISRFEATFQKGQGPFVRGQILSGGYAHAAGVIVTGVAVGIAD